MGIFKMAIDSEPYEGEFVAESVLEGISSILSIQVHDVEAGENFASLFTQDQIQNLGESLLTVISSAFRENRIFPNIDPSLPELSISEKGIEDENISSLWQLIMDHGTLLTSPDQFGHMDSFVHPVAALTDALVSIMNNNF